MAVGGTKVVQVTNIAPQATKDQMQTLFGYLGKIDDIRLYPTVRDVSCPVQSRICYIRFMESNTVGIAQHMTNTVFIDRALIVIPVQNGDIPDEYYALEMTRNGTIVPGLCPSEPKLPPNVTNSISGTGLEQVILTSDPQLDAHALPPYPPLPVNYDSCKIEEIRRTILLGNVDMSTTVMEIADFFCLAGEVKYVRTCRRATDASEYFLVEFSEQSSILNALKMHGRELKGRNVTIRHSTQAIVKPQAKSNEAAQREIEEAMSRVKEAQSMISAAIDPVIGMLSKDKRSSRRSRSRSRGRRRRSRSRSRRSRSRGAGGGGGGGGAGGGGGGSSGGGGSGSGGGSGRRRSRSRSRDRRRRSRSRHRSRSRSRGSNSNARRRSRTPSPTKTKSSSRRRSSKERRSRDKSKERRSRDKSRERSSRRDVDSKKEKRSERDRDNREEDDRIVDTSRERKRSRSVSPRPRYRSRDRSRDKSSRSKDKKRSRSRDRKRRSPSREKRRRSRSKSKERKRDRKERKERSRSRSKVPRNYDEEEKGFDSEKEHSAHRHGSDTVDKEVLMENSDNMDISNSP